ncbi:uncharacterized protein FMAN_04009 [Fusarium mangiferae]|uniref:DUF7580 domain-containing protein n=1 Tax=Fusarium mangiferae TaxID=192010 RepID=A0A1L7SZE4_FUSMA|nr:uncharacterized protein FMAN_04009 [Fusarium mangiferae]CVK89852.1 uncharacterized protein FMAN_04009 [Fusarium mangiferae]
MSGLEIAGLVLGAIPIAIETLKMGSQGIVIYKRSRRYENELERLMNKFENERVRLQDVFEKLLVDLVPHSRIESLVQNPLGLLEDEPELNAKLRRRLWRGFDLFNKTLGEIKTAMEEATERINVQVQDKSNLKRSLRHSFLDDLLTRINEGTSILEQLVDRGIELEPARKSRLQGKILCLMRNLANGVFGAVRASFDCPCEHHVCLQLEKRIIDMMPDDAEDYPVLESINFHLALSYKSSGSKTPPLSSNDRAWFEMLVKATPKPLPQAPVHTNKPETKRRFRVIKLVGRQLRSRASPSPVSDPVKVSDNSVELEAASKDLEQSPTNLDLCEKIRQPTTTGSLICYGLLFDVSAPKTHTYNAYPIIPSKFREKCDRTMISLNQVLGLDRRYMVLSEKERLRLAVIIAANILQLYGSPWMPAAIRSWDIYLIQGQDDPTCERFFVLQTLPIAEGPSRSGGFGLASMRNQSLFYLGVLLIELAFGKSLELLRSECDKSSTGSQFFADYRTAKRLADQVTSFIGPNYGSAVSRCIDGEFHGRGVGLEDQDLSHDVYAGVVALLEKELEG